MTNTPKLVMGHIVCIGPDDEESIPYDEAVIHLEGDEDSEIRIDCPGALRLAPLIVKAVNNHEALMKALADLEGANDKLAGLRTQEQYMAMLDAGQEFALADLQDARRAAVTLIRAVDAAHD